MTFHGDGGIGTGTYRTERMGLVAAPRPQSGAA